LAIGWRSVKLIYWQMPKDSYLLMLKLMGSESHSENWKHSG
jgi:hypothetical protein